MMELQAAGLRHRCEFKTNMSCPFGSVLVMPRHLMVDYSTDHKACPLHVNQWHMGQTQMQDQLSGFCFLF